MLNGFLRTGDDDGIKTKEEAGQGRDDRPEQQPGGRGFHAGGKLWSYGYAGAAANGLCNAAKKCCHPAMSPRQFQSHFFGQLGDPASVRAIFDHLPEIFFFVKDRAGRMVSASSTILNRLGYRTEEELIGKRDEDLYPPALAQAYSADDAEVFRTGEPLVERLEIWFDEQRNLDWGVTTKVPLRNRRGKIIGLMGVTRRDPRRVPAKEEGETSQAVQYLRQHADRLVSPAELARHLNISTRTLSRRIGEAFGISPYELALRTRLQAAAEALVQTHDEISAIALAHGFCDQSAFSQHFRRRMGTTPRRFRLRHQPSIPAQS